VLTVNKNVEEVTKVDDTKAQPDANTQIGAIVGSTNSGLTVGEDEAQPANAPVDLIERAAVSEAELEAIFRQAASTNSVPDADLFFRRFEYLNQLLGNNPMMALVYGRQLLFHCKRFDPALYAKIHKGTPYYWLGMAAFFVKDFQTATFFFDAAVSEDIRAGLDPARNPSPSFHFILIDGGQPNQAAQLLVKSMQRQIEAQIDQYNQRGGRHPSCPSLDIGIVRDHFLRPALTQSREPWRSLATTLITFVLEIEYLGNSLDLRVGTGTSEPFYLNLFKGCVLFESLLKANPKNAPTQQTLGQVLRHLAADLGLTAAPTIGNTDFPTVVSDVASANNDIATSIEFTGRVRNTVGHNLGWNATFDRSQYDKLAGMVASACLHAINCLYR